MHFMSEDMRHKNCRLKNINYCYDARADEWFLATRRQIMKWAEENAIEDLTIDPLAFACHGFTITMLEINYTMPKDWRVYPELSGKQIKELNERRS